MRFNFFFFPFLCSIALSILFFLYHNESFPQFLSTQEGEGCIVFSLSDRHDDRIIRESLDGLGLGSFISESSQIVYLDDFTGLRNISLDLYDNIVLDFDPRNDGYPALLRSFFVRDGSRFFFLPLDNVSGLNINRLNRQLSVLFPELDYDINILGRNNVELSPIIFFLLYSAACILAFLLSAHKKYFLHFMPLFFALGISGIFKFYVFIPALFIYGILELFRQPILEMQGRKNYVRNFVLIPLLLIFLFVYSFFSDFAIMPILLLIGGFGIILLLLDKNHKLQRRKSSHILFNPVLFFPVKTRTFNFFPLLPFLLFYALFLSFLPFSGNTGDLDRFEYDTAYIINADDYYRHINFQLSFSHMPFGQEQIISDTYYEYFLDEDGLISGRRAYRAYRMEEMDLPPFPLYKLMDFLVVYQQEGDLAVHENVKEWIMTAFILLFCLLDIIKPRKNQKRFAFFEKFFPASGNKDLPV